MVPFSPYPLQHLLLVDIYDGHSVWCIVLHNLGVWICSSLIISDIDHVFMCFGTSICLLFRNVYLDPLPMFFPFFNFFFLVFLGPQSNCMEVPRLGVESELFLPAYTIATAMPDGSHVCDLPHSSWQHWIL